MNIISDVPTKGTQISLTLPANIPAPKFHLFQQVRRVHPTYANEYKHSNVKPWLATGSERLSRFETYKTGMHPVRTSERRLGIITGMEFVTLETALLQCIRGFNWKYVVNYVYAASPEEVIEFDDEPVDEYWEHGLEAVEG